MENLIRHWLVIVAITIVLQGCSRPGNTEVDIEPDPFQYQFIAEDASLIGLSVIDSAGVEATETEPGLYQFQADYVPSAPIKFVSKNGTDANITFQDMDANGERSAPDFNYNVGLEIAYIGSFSTSGNRNVFANPVTALIPSTGVPSEGIGGLPQDLVNVAFLAGIAGAPTSDIEIAEGVTISVRAVLSRTAALITAMQEGVYLLEGSNEAAANIAIAMLSTVRDASITEGLTDTSVFSQAIQSAIESNVSQQSREAAISLASALGNLTNTVTVGDSTQFYEAIVRSVQLNINGQSTAADITTKITLQEFNRLDLNLQYAIKLANEIESNGGMAEFLNSLSIIPIEVGDNGSSLVAEQVSDFNLEYLAETAEVKLNATNAFFDQSHLQYYFEDDLYGVKVDNNHAVLIALNANETNLLGAAQAGINSARLFALCWNETEQNDNNNVCGNENTNLEYYALATANEVCAFGFDEAELAVINTLNRQQITCN